jgi:S1-C subfamily serine protease
MASERTPNLLAQFSDELANAVERAGQSVYTVHGGRRQPGSGIAWPGGYVVTADHIVHPDVMFWRRRPAPAESGERFTVKLPEPEQAQEFAVTGADGQRQSATLVGHDPASDLAVLKLTEGSVHPPELAPPGSVRSGSLVLALGRPSGNGIASSFGAVVAVGERWWTVRGGVIEGYVRADVTMYPGFSGGPLIDASGRVIGLNSSLLARGEHVAILASSVDTLVQKLASGQQVRRAYLGISSQPTHLPAALRESNQIENERALLVIWVEPDSPAEQAGIMVGDLLIRLADHPVASARDLLEVLTPERVGKPASVVLLRGGTRQEVTVTPSQRD